MKYRGLNPLNALARVVMSGIIACCLFFSGCSHREEAAESSAETNRLLERLKHEDSDVRKQAARALGTMKSKRAVEPLVAALKKKDSGIHEEASVALGEIGDSRAVDPLIDVLKGTSLYSKEMIQLALLSSLLDDDAFDGMDVGKLLINDTSTRAAAARALGKIGDPKAIAPLIAQLDYYHPMVQTMCVEALWRMGAARVKPLLPAQGDCPTTQVAGLEMLWQTKPNIAEMAAALRSKNHFVRAIGAIALGELKDQQGTDSLIAALKDQETLVRANAAKALGMLKDPKAVEALSQTLNGKLYYAQQESAIALAEIGGSAINLLVDNLVIKPDRESGSAKAGYDEFMSLTQKQDLVKDALSLIGAPAVKPLLDSLKTEDPDRRKTVIEVLGRNGDAQAIEAVIAALNDQDKFVRVFATDAAARIGDKRAVEPIIAALNDTESSVRKSAAKALGRLRDGRAFEPLLATSKDKDPDVRAGAVEALGDLNDVRAIEKLIDALRDAEVGVQNSAIGALVKMGSPAVDPLLAALKDVQAGVRVRAAEALGKMKEGRAVDPLITALKDEDKKADAKAAWALGKIKDTRAVDPLIAELKDADWDTRNAAAIALGRIGDRRAVEPLMATMQDPDYLNGLVREDLLLSAELKTSPSAVDTLSAMGVTSAIEALGGLKDPRAVEPLLALLKNDMLSVRIRAALGLRAIESPAVEPLLAALNDSNSSLREAAVAGLEGNQEPRVIEALIAAFKDANPKNRPMITHAMRKAGPAGIETLFANLKNESLELRRRLARDVFEMGQPAIAPLINVVKSGDRRAQRDAATLLGGLEGPSLKMLLPLLKQEKGESLKHIARALDESKNQCAILKMHELVKSGNISVAAGAYRSLISRGDPIDEPILIQAMTEQGDATMGEDFVNCNNSRLEKAGRQWGYKNGYYFIRSTTKEHPVQWGKSSDGI